VLSNKKKRFRYDLSLGIHRYKKVPLILRALKLLSRIILTILDGLMRFYWFFLFTTVAYVLVGSYINNGYIDFMNIYENYRDESQILFLLALIDALLHFYVRRLNRFLKHYNWEVGFEEYVRGK
jgi:hypothetical protein